jgi:hypothetical protein
VLDGVELRAFRGTRRSSTYRAHTLGGDVAARIAGAAALSGLTALATLAEGEERVLDKREARAFADAASSLRTTALVLDADHDLVALAEIANWCARARGRAWLRVRPLG